MINWESFKQQLSEYNLGRQSGSIEESANFYSTLYFDEVQNSAINLIGNKIIYNISSKNILYQGFYNFFTSNIALQTGVITNANIFPLALSIVNFWNIQQFEPLPPHPPATIPSPGIKLTPKTNASLLSTQLLASFITTQNALFITLFTLALQTYTLSLMGNYYGLQPSTGGPIPIVVPWVSVI